MSPWLFLSLVANATLLACYLQKREENKMNVEKLDHWFKEYLKWYTRYWDEFNNKKG